MGTAPKKPKRHAVRVLLTAEEAAAVEQRREAAELASGARPSQCAVVVGLFRRGLLAPPVLLAQSATRSAA